MVMLAAREEGISGNGIRGKISRKLGERGLFILSARLAEPQHRTSERIRSTRRGACEKYKPAGAGNICGLPPFPYHISLYFFSLSDRKT